MKDDFSHYEAMRDAGAQPVLVYQSAKADGFDPVTLIRLLRHVYQLSLVQAKEVSVIGDGLAETLAEYQERLIGPLEEALNADMRSHGSDKPEIELE
jgi:hypothetical protein